MAAPGATRRQFRDGAEGRRAGRPAGRRRRQGLSSPRNARSPGCHIAQGVERQAGDGPQTALSLGHPIRDPGASLWASTHDQHVRARRPRMDLEHAMNQKHSAHRGRHSAHGGLRQDPRREPAQDRRAQAQPAGRGRPLCHLLFRELRHDVDRRSTRCCYIEKGGPEQVARGDSPPIIRLIPQGPGARRHLHDRDRRSRTAQAHPRQPRRDRGHRVHLDRRRAHHGRAGSRSGPHQRGRQGVIGAVRAFSLYARADRGIPRRRRAGDRSALPIKPTATWRCCRKPCGPNSPAISIEARCGARHSSNAKHPCMRRRIRYEAAVNIGFS